MDILAHLSRIVTPAVLEGSASPQKEGLLKQFYAVLAAKLTDQTTFDHAAKQDIHNDDLGLFDRLWSDDANKSSLIKGLVSDNQVDESVVKGLLVSAAPMALNEIKSLSGTTPVPQFLRDNLSSFRDLIPSWATGFLPAGLLGLGAGAAGAHAAHANAAGTTAANTTAAHVNEAGHRISDTTSMKPLHHEEKEGGGFLKALLPIIGLIILAALAWALLKGCQSDPAPVAAPDQTTQQQPAENAVAGTTALAPAVLSLATGEGNELFACRISAGNDELGNSVINSVKDVFGTGTDNCRADIDDSFDTDMPAAPHLAAILPLIKDTPNANVIIEGDEVRIDAPDQAQLDKLVADIKEAAPELNVVAAGPLDFDAEVEQSIADAHAAMDNLGENPDPKDVARALSIQVINFAVDKTDIPEENQAVLDRAVEVMKQVPDMELMIIGHTDSDGQDAYNQDLSQRRADSVKDYLVSKGVDASKLMTKGMGETDPIATNETDNGKFRNRRIEFTVHDETAMGTQDIEVVEDAAKVDDSAEQPEAAAAE
ncbi:OmpA family protein [Psychrobacter sp. FDAARGOS_221]|uniref:OmpA family protein n=1 Tax=Psychrobacter sp. FDAARGOS_221 TaxID=1975705 RepID=UPI000BB55BA2|nr:OmpA family protein [Psychrobacter sp. FDAARGOS_221]PNK60436.1 OmpA family protein [Psychrobacter sp. FDAARGOS_221]